MAKKKSKAKSSKSRARAKKAAPKRKAARKTARKAAAKPSLGRLKPFPGKPATLIVAAPEKRLAGKVTHYYNKISVGIIELTDSDLAAGDEISIEGPHTNIQQKIDSMQVEHEAVNVARIGQVIGLKVKDRVHEKDLVYKVIKRV